MPSTTPPDKSSLTKFAHRYANVLFFVGGFVFDAFTLVRIDSVLDLVWQLGYLLLITWLIVLQARAAQGHFTPTGWVAKLWHHETEALHFCYGGLLSGYVIFYFKSTSFSRSLVFLGLIAILMVANEMPQIKRLGFRMRLGLYAFCVVSYLTYLLPVIIGRMGWLIFFVGWVLACVITHYMVRLVARGAENPEQSRKILSVSPAVILLLILTLYTLKLIPPVPLSLRHLDICRSVERVDERYRLLIRKPPWHHFWQTDDRDFPARPGEPVISFLSVFGPRRFTHQLFVRWKKWDERSGKWLTSDRVSVPMRGGRADGYRGFAQKENYEPGRWQVEVETEDERVLGSKTFYITEDLTTDERPLTYLWR